MGAFDLEDDEAPMSAPPPTVGFPPRQLPGAVPGVPLLAHEQPLPHDGLFIRRNNAFGTKSTLGIRDLIEQGVLIEQTQIRFDDFVVATTDQIPAPVGGEAITVSHGAAAILGSYKAHELSTHFLEVALQSRARTLQGEEPHQDALPVNFVFVVDTSSSMSGEKLDTVKTAIRELYAQLRDTDILGIVTFDTQVRTVLKATPKGQLSQDHLTHSLAICVQGAAQISIWVCCTGSTKSVAMPTGAPIS